MSSVNTIGLSKRYGNLIVVPSLDLQIKENEFLSLLGPSGCGKTTILRMVAGLETPSDGRIEIGSQTVFDAKSKIYVAPERRDLGMVFQSYAVWPHLSVLENVIFPLKCRKVGKTQRVERAMAALKSVRLDGYEKRKPNQLSGGQQQRVALARALVAQPKVLLLDEPLSNLDANLRDEMCEEIAQIKTRFPMTMIYVTHDQSEAFRLSDRIALLNKGSIEQLASPTEIRNSPKSEFVKKFLKL